MVFKSETRFLFRIARWFFMEKGKVFENRSGTYMEKVHIFVMKNQVFVKKSDFSLRKITSFIERLYLWRKVCSLLEKNDFFEEKSWVFSKWKMLFVNAIRKLNFCSIPTDNANFFWFDFGSTQKHHELRKGLSMVSLYKRDIQSL